MDLTNEQLNKLFEFANMQTPVECLENDINKAIIEIEKKLSTCAISTSDYQTDKNVLIVDDLEITLHQLTLLLNKSGFNVHVARNKEEAIHNLKKHKYEYVFIDLYIPDIQDGKDLISLSKSIQNKNNINCSIAVISGTEDEKLIAECLTIGADEFIQKTSSWHKNVLKFIKLSENKIETSNEDYLVNYDYSDSKLLHITIRKFHVVNTIEKIEKDIVSFASSGHKNIVLNFKNITSIKQQQASLLASCYSKCNKEGIKLALCSISNQIYDQLSYVFLTDIIKIYKNIDEAIEQLK